jgi:hypothetical protein
MYSQLEAEETRAQLRGSYAEWPEILGFDVAPIPPHVVLRILVQPTHSTVHGPFSAYAGCIGTRYLKVSAASGPYLSFSFRMQCESAEVP